MWAELGRRGPLIKVSAAGGGGHGSFQNLLQYAVINNEGGLQSPELQELVESMLESDSLTVSTPNVEAIVASASATYTLPSQ